MPVRRLKTMASPLTLSNSFSHSMSFGESSLPSIPSGVAELLVQSSASAELVDMDEFLQDYMQDLQNQALYDSIAVPKPLDTPPEVSPTVAPAADLLRAEHSDGTDGVVAAFAPSEPSALKSATPFANFRRISSGGAASVVQGSSQATPSEVCPPVIDTLRTLPKIEPVTQTGQECGNVGDSAQTARAFEADSRLFSLDGSQAKNALAQGGLGETKEKTGFVRQPPKRSQEKNRRAQQRFRDRRKARVAELEAQVATLQARVARLMQEASENEAKLACMSHVLNMKDSTIARLQALLPNEPSQDGRKLEQDGVPLLTTSFKESLTLTVRDEPMVLTPEAVKSLTREQLCRLWKEYVNQLSVILVEIHQTREPVNGPRHQRISRLVDEVCLLGMRAALANPQAFRLFVACSMEDGSMAPCSDRTRWREVMWAIGLSMQQRVQLRQVRSMVLDKMAEIEASRRPIYDKLQADIKWVKEGQAEDAKRMLEAQTALDEMRASLRQEMILKLDFNFTCYKHLLTPIQVAKMLVKAYPFSPDNMGICTWIAAEDGDPVALHELMRSKSGMPEASSPRFRPPGSPLRSPFPSRQPGPPVMPALAIERALSSTQVVCKAPTPLHAGSPASIGGRVGLPEAPQHVHPTITTGVVPPALGVAPHVPPMYLRPDPYLHN